MNKGRLVVVRNPNASRAKLFDKHVSEPLATHGESSVEIQTESADFEANVAQIQGYLKSGDTLLVASGDGVVSQAANAILRSGQEDVTLAPLGLGNFNDLAGPNKNPLKLLAGSPVDWHPMTAEVNGEYWRHAPAYLTIGVTAIAAAGFGDMASRERQRGLPEQLKLASSLGQLGATYFRERDTMLPAFHTSLSPVVQRAATDILAVNNRRVGRIIRAEDYGPTDVFGYKQADISKVIPNLPFGFEAVFRRAPAEPIDDLTINFEQPSDIPIQSEGEFARLTGVSSVSIHKNLDDSLKILRP